MVPAEKTGNLTDHQRVKLRKVLRYNLKSVRAYLHKEDFQRFWKYESPVWAGKFLDQCCRDVMRSKIDPLKKFIGTLRNHRELLLNYFRAKKTFSSGVVEGLNNKAKVTMRKAYGYKTYEKCYNYHYIMCLHVLACAWKATRTATQPQIFLTNLNSSWPAWHRILSWEGSSPFAKTSRA